MKWQSDDLYYLSYPSGGWALVNTGYDALHLATADAMLLASAHGRRVDVVRVGDGEVVAWAA